MSGGATYLASRTAEPAHNDRRRAAVPEIMITKSRSPDVEVLTQPDYVSERDDAGGGAEERLVDVVAAFPSDAQPFIPWYQADGRPRSGVPASACSFPRGLPPNRM